MISDKHLAEYKKIFKKKYGKDISDEDAREHGERLMAFAEILVKHAEIEYRRKKRLEKEPEGFFLEPEHYYNCGLCGDGHSGDEIWWNEEGLRCTDCRRNILAGVVPHLKNKYKGEEDWFLDWKVKYDYDVHSATARKLRREGLLHGRDLKRADGKVYHTIYLKKENVDFLKKYPKIDHRFRMTMCDKDGKQIEL